MRTVKVFSVAALVVSSVGSQASGANQLVWDNGVPSLLTGWNFINEVTDDFRLAERTSITRIDAYLWDLSEAADFSKVFAKVDGELLSATATGWEHYATMNGWIQIHRVSFDVSGAVFGKGRHVLELGLTPRDNRWGWAHADDFQLWPSKLNGAIPWYTSYKDTAFSIHGVAAPVPEPGTTALLSAGLLAVALRTARRRAATLRTIA